MTSSSNNRAEAREKLDHLVVRDGKPEERADARRTRLDRLRDALSLSLMSAAAAGKALIQRDWAALADALASFRRQAAAADVEEAVVGLISSATRPAALETIDRAVEDLRPLGRFAVGRGGATERRDWVIPGWLPAGRVTRLSSHGGSGKTYLALELAVAIASGTDPNDMGPTDIKWRAHEDVGCPVLRRTPSAHGYREASSRERKHSLYRLALDAERATTLYISWEDEPEEFERRWAALPSERKGAVGSRVSGLNLEGFGALWAARGGGHRDTEGDVTGVGRRVEALIREMRPRLVVIDPVAAAYGCNENDRAAVRRWLSHLNSLARETSAAILLISHPPKHSGSDYSGSTDWDNGVRAAWTLDPKTAPRWSYTPGSGKAVKPAQGLALTLTKANYARQGQFIWLRWTRAPGLRGLEECGEEEAAKAWHEDRGLPAPTENPLPPHPRRSDARVDRTAGGVV